MGAEAIRGAASEGFDRLAEAHILTSFNLPVLSLPLIGQLDPIAWFGVFEVIGTVMGVTVMEVVRRKFTVTSQTSNATVARWLMFLYGMTTACIVAFALANNFWIAVVAFLLKGVFYGPPGPISGTWMNLHIPSRVRATVLSMNGQANAFGQFGGGPGVGWVATALAFAQPLPLPGCCTRPCCGCMRALCAGRMRRRKRLTWVKQFRRRWLSTMKAAQQTPDLAGLNAEHQPSAGFHLPGLVRGAWLASRPGGCGTVAVYGAALTPARSGISLAYSKNKSK
ncbi:MAG: MFS transporter [Anaerolineae bacterium]|nr:MFS transporter [Anaerolineae bacterium]